MVEVMRNGLGVLVEKNLSGIIRNTTEMLNLGDVLDLCSFREIEKRRDLRRWVL